MQSTEGLAGAQPSSLAGLAVLFQSQVQSQVQSQEWLVVFLCLQGRPIGRESVVLVDIVNSAAVHPGDNMTVDCL